MMLMESLDATKLTPEQPHQVIERIWRRAPLPLRLKNLRRDRRDAEAAGLGDANEWVNALVLPTGANPRPGVRVARRCGALGSCG
jgi:hypothetical protein